MEELIRQLVAANIEQRAANTAQQQTNAHLLEQTQALFQQSQVQAQAFQQQSQAQAQAIQQQTQRLTEVVQTIRQRLPEESTGAGSHQAMVHGKHYLIKMTAEDDPEAFLVTFERTAEREKWPKAQWAGLVAPLLTGESQKAYSDLELAEAQDYDKLKQEILARLGVTLAVRAQRVTSWSFQTNQAPRSQMFELRHLVRKWLQPETLTGPQIVERVVMDKYLRSLPVPLQRWVSQGDPKTGGSLVDLVERYFAAENLGLPHATPRTVHPKPRSPQEAGKTVPGELGGKPGRDNGGRMLGVKPGGGRPRPGKTVPVPRFKWGNIQCFRCQEYGHIAANCPMVDEPMECDWFEKDRRRSLYANVACTAAPLPGKHECVMTVNNQQITVLLDSGSLVTLINASLIPPVSVRAKKVRVICVHGDTRQYPLATVRFGTPRGGVTHLVGVVPHLVHKAIIGRDFPQFWELWDRPEVSSVSGERSEAVADTTKVDSEASSQDYPGFPFSVLAGDLEETEVLPPAGDSGPPPTATEVALEFADLKTHKDNFGTEQRKDPTLIRAWENVVVVNGEPVEPGDRLSYPYFSSNRDLLYRVYKRNEEVVEQLVVPKPYRKTVLELAHGHLLGGHLGVEKTQERVLQRFYWPGIHQEIQNHCSSCPVCQVSAPLSHFRSPLVPLPIIEVPFERIAMDLVGPLPKSARGHQHILVIMDYATRYPEAIPLRNTAAKNIARELFLVFSRVGIPKELLTDQGTPFMSRVTKELCKLFKVTHLRTSIYHPQTDGLVERFNKTLKRMLKKVVDKDGKNWDFLLPYLMFAIREVPQSSTGYSPFELLYGRHPKGLLDIARETWEEEKTPYKSVIEHIAQMQDRIAVVMPLVKQHLAQAQEAQQRVYNRGAKVRNFSAGDRVLVLVPTVESKFLAKWQGPFEILEKIGDVNYKVHQPGKRKPIQIYHVNLLKPWKDRESLVVESAPVVLQVNTRSSQVPEVKIADTLSSVQKREVRDFLIRNRDKFSDFPGQTVVAQHDIITEPGVRVKLKPYRIPEARRKDIREKVTRMLDLDIIEESNSDWSSPIVLVPKPDGSWRFCNDFRKLNEVTKFDIYPMPRVDELIDRLGKARYLTTLDLTKGYWQIPLTKSAREKTAFVTPEGSFQYKKMPFGLQNAPATFQRTMDKTLRPHQQYAAAYLDDIVIHSNDWDSHLPRVQAVLESLFRAGFTANPKKCAVGLEEAKYLGYTIGRGLIKPQLDKTEAILDWPRPVNKKQVRAFLGITGYYRRFIPNFATIAAPLTDLTKGNTSVMVKWSPEAEEAFQVLKRALCAQPVLYSPDFSKNFIVQTDASEVGLGAVLSQVQDGEEHPIVYLSRKLNDQERRYAIIEKECLAIKWAVDALRYYLLGRQFELITDHAPLKWMATKKETNRRINRWFLALQDYSFTVKHRPGSKMGNADGLSRVHSCWASRVPTRLLKHGGGICDRRAVRDPGRVLYGIYTSPRFLSQSFREL